MAYVLGKFESDYSDESRIIGGAADYSNCFFGHHDIFSGDFIAARCLGNTEGAELYWFENLSKDRSEALKVIGKLLTPENVRVRLLPWFQSEPMPITLDNGESGRLTIQHRPDIIIQKFQLLEEDSY